MGWKRKHKWVKSNEKIVLPIRNVFEMTARLLEPQGITVAHKSTKTVNRSISNPKEKLKTDGRRNVVLEVQCEDCDKCHTGQTGTKRGTWMREPKLVTRINDPFSTNIHSRGPENGFHCGPREHKTFKGVSGSWQILSTQTELDQYTIYWVSKFKWIGWYQILGIWSILSHFNVTISNTIHCQSASYKYSTGISNIAETSNVAKISNINVQSRSRRNLHAGLTLGSKSDLAQRH